MFKGKRNIGPKVAMKKLEIGEFAEVEFLSLPREFSQHHETGHGEDGHSKWELDINLIKHPRQDSGKMVWHTVAWVIREEIIRIMNENKNHKKLLEELKEEFHYIYRTEVGMNLCDEEPEND